MMNNQEIESYANSIFDSMKYTAIANISDAETLKKIQGIFDDPEYKTQAINNIKEKLDDVYTAGKLDGTSDQAIDSENLIGSLRADDSKERSE